MVAPSGKRTPTTSFFRGAPSLSGVSTTAISNIGPSAGFRSRSRVRRVHTIADESVTSPTFKPVAWYGPPLPGGAAIQRAHVKNQNGTVVMQVPPRALCAEKRVRSRLTAAIPVLGRDVDAVECLKTRLNFF